MSRLFVNPIGFYLHTKKWPRVSRFQKSWFPQDRGKQEVASARNNMTFIMVKMYRAWKVILKEFDRKSLSRDH